MDSSGPPVSGLECKSRDVSQEQESADLVEPAARRGSLR